MERAKQVVVVITGMHRSGTSLVASILQYAGVYIGENLLGPFKGNPHGHYEDVGFYRFHERVLSRFGKSIFVPHVIAPEKILDEEREAAQMLLEQRKNRRLWGWKDPRTSLFLDFWHGCLPGTCCVFIYRHPVEVVLSLMRRGTDPEVWDNPFQAVEAWQVHNECILDYSRKHRERCRLCHIHRITEDIGAFIRIVSDTLGLPLRIEHTDACFHASELKEVFISKETGVALQEMMPQAAALYERLQKEADLPGSPWETGLSGPRGTLPGLLGSPPPDRLVSVLRTLDPDTFASRPGPEQVAQYHEVWKKQLAALENPTRPMGVEPS